MTTSDRPVEAADETKPSLRHGSTSIWSTTVLGLASMQIGPCMALAGGYMVAYTGDASWLAMALAVLIAGALAVGISAFARHTVATGGLMSYVGSTLGPKAKAFTAAGYVCAYAVGFPAIVTGVVIFTSSFFVKMGFESASSGLVQASSAVVLAILAAGIAYRGLDASVRVTGFLTFAAIPFVLWVTVAAALKGDFNLGGQFDFSGDAFSPAIVIPGVVIAASNFVGFEAVSALAGETKDPKRNVPRLLALLLTVCGVSYIVMIWAQIPSLNGALDLLAAGESPTAILADVGGVGFLAAPLDLLLAGATFAGLIASMNYGSRIVGTAAADGLLPKRLARIHPVRRTPHVAIFAIGLVAGGIPVVLQLVASSPPLDSSVYLYTFYAYFYLALYVLAAVAAIVLHVQLRMVRPVRIAIIAVSGVGWGYVFYYGLAHLDGGVFSALPWMAVGLTLAVFALFLVVRARNPDALDNMEDLL
ncbi:APC family permease [Mycolicibacterium sp. P9-64]|uniref:APC family permease n=1 Tax=Mycolicibacterium sp. P9-64 TaxID=2024612 RepID=UPI00156603D7|nr:APC family permease [Mycolicibacterium sp. P9-64]